MAAKRTSIKTAELPGPKSAELMKLKEKYISKAVSVGAPVFIDKASGSLFYDIDGNVLIDMGSGIGVMNVGHSQKELVEAVKKQAAKFIHTCFMVTPYEGYVRLAEKLANVAPHPGLPKSAIFNSGAEAVENSVKISRHFTKKQAAFSFVHAFHGRTMLAMSSPPRRCHTRRDSDHCPRPTRWISHTATDVRSTCSTRLAEWHARTRSTRSGRPRSSRARSRASSENRSLAREVSSFLRHNGEINTLQGNIAWMKTREPNLDLTGFGNLLGLLRPVIDTSGSDSAMLDNAVELLLQGGRDIRHAVAMLAPQAWEKLPDLPQHIRDFYAYHACLTEPWDGPAALVFTDGQTVGASLDRNGLRPCRYFVTEDGLIGAVSEAGAIPTGDRRIVMRGKLGPGQMILVETNHSVFLEDGQIKSELAARQPYTPHQAPQSVRQAGG